VEAGFDLTKANRLAGDLEDEAILEELRQGRRSSSAPICCCTQRCGNAPTTPGLGVLRISTHPRVLKRPLTVEQAIGLIDGWPDPPMVHLIEPVPRSALP
jgi:hypothetical protein